MIIETPPSEWGVFCPRCGGKLVVKTSRERGVYCEDCGWPDEDFDDLPNLDPDSEPLDLWDE